MTSGTDPLVGVRRFIDRAYSMLGDISYYQLLNISPESTTSEIRKAYYKFAARLHPDLFSGAVDEELKRKLTAVFSRVAEAYQVLTKPAKRRLYDEGLATGATRLSADAAARKPRPVEPEDQIKSLSAKKFFLLGQTALRGRNYSSAIMNFQMALSMESNSEVIRDFLERAKAGD